MKFPTNDIEQYLYLFPARLIRGYLWVWLILINLVGLPTSLYGSFNHATRIVLLPFVGIISLWSVYLMINTEQKREQYVFFSGVYSLILSIIFMITSYKFIIMVAIIPIKAIVLVFIIYLLILVLNFVNVISLLKRGFYSRKNIKRVNKGTGLIVAMSVSGVAIGRVFTRIISEQTGIIVLSFILLFLALILATGTHNILKYYLLKINKKNL